MHSLFFRLFESQNNNERFPETISSVREVIHNHLAHHLDNFQPRSDAAVALLLENELQVSCLAGPRRHLHLHKDCANFDILFASFAVQCHGRYFRLIHHHKRNGRTGVLNFRQRYSEVELLFAEHQYLPVSPGNPFHR